MQNPSFEDITPNYERIINDISNSILQTIFQKFNFAYLIFEPMKYNHNEQKFIDYILKYIQNYKFIVYNIHQPNINKYLTNNRSQVKHNYNNNAQGKYNTYDFIICLEGECLIIENISESSLKIIIDQLNNQQISLINLSSEHIFSSENIISEANDEIANFCQHFNKEMQKSEFIKSLIPTLAGYLIRRYYYPSEYFKDRSFFTFGSNESMEKQIKTRINDFLLEDDPVPKLVSIADSIESYKNITNNQNNLIEFQEKEFVKLRTIKMTYKASYDLVIHLSTLYIFVRKKVLGDNQREINFCRTYSHRCLTKCYGLLKKGDKFIGFLYEFQSNGSLSFYFSKNNVSCFQDDDISFYLQYNDIFSLITLTRIFEAIKYLHSNSLIHRDIKPSNILLDHDNLAYLNDYETIRSIADNDETTSIFTYDFGTPLYSSPEQDKGENISFSTDIYSFGLIIYYIKEKKDMWTSIYSQKDKQIKSITRCSPNYQYLFEKCVLFEPKKRITNEDIQIILNEEFCSHLYFDEYFLQGSTFNKKSQLIEFIFDKIAILKSNDLLPTCLEQILCFQFLYANKKIMKKSMIYLTLGVFYEQGLSMNLLELFKYFEATQSGIKDYFNSKDCNELSSKFNNSEALNYLGFIFEEGICVKQDYIKASLYYELSSKYHNSDALVNLGNNYLNGKGVKQDYSIAKECYESSSKFNNSDAFFSLGNLYFNGYGVGKNYGMAEKYYKLSAKLNNPKAIYHLANIYHAGPDYFQDSYKSIKYYLLASKFGKSNSLYELGKQYEINETEIQDYSKAKEYYIISAKLGNSDALFNLGNFYEKGLGVVQNYAIAIKFYKLASKLNHVEALIKLGKIYEEGIDVDQNYMKAKEYYELASKLNNSEALYRLGNFYENGNGVEQDYNKAREYYELSSKLNNSDALNSLGVFYEEGLGVKQDFLKAKKYYEMALEYDNSDAINNLGFLYSEGLGVKKDYLKAKKYFEISSEMNNSDAFYNLGDLYYFGNGVKQNFLKAKRYYDKSSKLNNSSAIYSLGIMYYYGQGVKQDFTKARELFESASESDNPNALKNLGELYYYGDGVKQNFTTAKKYFEKSSEFCNSSAFLYLGILYENGYGVEKNYMRAKEYYEISSAFDNSDALNHIGKLYENGKGVEQDYLKAKEYYELSSNLNNSKALLNLGDLYYNGYGVKQDYLKAKQFYELSSSYNNSTALANLGDLYYNGYGVKKDIKKSAYFYELSSNLNNPYAHFNLGILYSTDDNIDINLHKAIKYFLKSISVNRGTKFFYNTIYKVSEMYFETNDRRYISYNDLGLIYHIVLEDEEKAESYIKESAFAEYPFGQNNFGLFNQFYLNKIENANYMYERSSKHKFALAEYNLGYLRELNHEIKESIQYYIQASEHEDEKLVFRDITHYDIRLDISKTFIICLTNLKLTDYYFSFSNFFESKKYFVRCFDILKKKSQKLTYPYKFRFKHHNFSQEKERNDIFSYLKKFILMFPLFNLFNQPNQKIFSILKNCKFSDDNLNLKENENKSMEENVERKNIINKKDIKDIFSIIEKDNNIFNKKENNLTKNKTIYNEKSQKIEIQNQVREENNDLKEFKHIKNNQKNVDDDILFEEPSELFDFLIQNPNLKTKNGLNEIFIKEIQDIILIMNKILYTPPYSILFGRISFDKIKQEKEETNNHNIDINHNFYDGFESF